MGKVTLRDVRISFCQALFVPEQYQGKGVARYSSTFLTEPGSANDKAIEAEIKAVALEKWPKKAQATIDSMRGNTNMFCYQNGDMKDYDGYQGMKYLAGHRKESDGPPLVIDRNKSPLDAKSGRPYGGCYVNATLDIFAQDGKHPGIRAGLLAVQFLRDGDSFGGAGKGKIDDFEDLGEGSDSDFENVGDDLA